MEETSTVDEQELDLCSTFGMCEMETAAAKAISHFKKSKYEFFSQFPVCLDHMKGNFEINGFLQLVSYGWLEHHPQTKRCFFPGPEMVKKLATKLGDQPWLVYKEPDFALFEWGLLSAN
jgi:hypothetical protein